MVKLSVENIGQDAMDFNLAKAGYTAFYVDGTNGLDTYPGDSWDQPFKTIQHAVDTAESWAQIFIKAGTYAENVTINKDSISLIGQSRDSVKIAPSTGTALTISNPNFSAESLSTVSNENSVYSIEVDGTYCTLSNVEVVATVDYGRGIHVNAAYSTLRQIYASDALMDLAVVFASGLHNAEITDSYLNPTKSDAYAIGLAANADNIIIRDNTIKGSMMGVYAFSGASNNTIFHNNFISVAYPISGADCDFFENYYSDHTNIDNGFGIATEPYVYGSTIDPRPVVARNGWNGLSWADADQVADILAIVQGTDNDFSSAPSQDYTTEKTVFEIASDTRYKIIGAWIDITPFTADDTITFQFYRAIDAGGATYRKAGAAISVVKDTDNPIVEFADFAHYGYTKITAISSPGRTVVVPFGYIKESME